jgi:hypothetical protein
MGLLLRDRDLVFVIQVARQPLPKLSQDFDASRLPV